MWKSRVNFVLRFQSIIILDIIQRPGSYLKHDLSETGFYLRQVEPTQLDPIDRANISLQTPATTKMGFLVSRDGD
jgi:hypothetical protein